MVSKEKIELLRQKIDEADAIVVGGASGMSAASGFVFYYQEDEVFRRMAGGLAAKYDRHNMFDLFYDRRPSRGEQWALMLRVIHYIYECYTGETYTDLAELLKGKDYYIATTNQGRITILLRPIRTRNSIVCFLPGASRAYKVIGDTGNAAVRATTRYITIRKRFIGLSGKSRMMPCPMSSYPAARIAARSWLRGCVATPSLKANITNGR